MTMPLIQWAVFGALSWLFWRYARKIFTISPLDNVPGPAAETFLYGDLRRLLDRRAAWDLLQGLTTSYSGIAKLHGPFGKRILYVFDPTALHNIIVKDQYIFEEAAWFVKSFQLLLGPGLLATLGDHHRKQRKLLNPVFSMAHMRRIVPIFNQVGHQLQDAIEKCVCDYSEPVEVDLLSWMARTALELIGQAGLGYSFDPLVSDKPDAFAAAIKAFQPLLMETALLRRAAPYVPQWIPASLRQFLVSMIPSDKVQRMKSVVGIMHERSVEIFEEKKRALEKGDEAVTRQVGEGNDIMSILLKANVAASDEDKLPEEELIGQMSTFIIAAMDTTSSALAQTLQLLAKHPDVQQKLRMEILDAFAAKEGEDLDYDALTALPYLDAVCRETLRLHPPITQVFRETRQDVVLPLSEPITGVDGSEMHEILIPKDTTVIVGILSSNRNKAVWGDDAGEWKPERWLGPLPGTVADAKIPGIYSNLMTFLGGGRACIGFKFSQLEMKVVLAFLLSKFTFALSDKRILWNFAGIRFPVVEGPEEAKPALPLKVGMYKPAASA